MNLLIRIQWFLFLGAAALVPPLEAGETFELISVQRIWSEGRHNAFTDLIRFQGQWFCTFREGDAHVGGDGKIRVLASTNGRDWVAAALLSEPGVDLRDPKLSVTPDARLMLTLGGSVYAGRTLQTRQPRVAFSRDGRMWTAPQRVLSAGEWLWRVTWHEGRAYGISYSTPARPAGDTNSPPDWRVNLYVSDDGVAFQRLAPLAVPGQPNEATLRFLANDDGVVLLRREGPGKDRAAWIGRSAAPYTDWQWRPAGLQIGGPNFIVLPGDRLIASGRYYGEGPGGARTFVGRMTLEGVTPDLILPSGGDCSYPGMVWFDGRLWLSYYSSHGGKSEIYLAQVRMD